MLSLALRAEEVVFSTFFCYNLLMQNIMEFFQSTDMDTDSRGRVYYFDNLKFWLIMLVVIGHFINPISGDYQFYKGLYMFIYTFHMPLFIFVTGYFAKSVIDRNTGRFRFEKLLHFLILYLFLTLVIFLINFYLIENTNSYKFFQPVNPGWYLLSTVLWYGLIPIINSIKPQYVIIGSIIIALAVGYDPMVGDYLTLSRTICFFPFFIVGYYVSQDQVERTLKFGGTAMRIGAFLFVIAFIVFCIWDPVGFYDYRRIVSPHYSYSELWILGDMYRIMGPVVRLLWYAAAALVSYAFMMVVSRHKNIITTLGQRTLQVYIWHAIAVRILNYAGLYKLVEISDSWYFIGLPVILAVALTFVFSWKPLGAPFNFVLSKKFAFCFKKDN